MDSESDKLSRAFCRFWPICCPKVLKFTPKGGEVKVGVWNEGTDGLLVVQDTGSASHRQRCPKRLNDFTTDKNCVFDYREETDTGTRG